MHNLLCFLLFLAISIQAFNAQKEKRLALVIGNADYDKGALGNPVNDALLMESTLKSLDFDVILDTNIATLQEFNATVRKFGDKRDEYNVGLIYYAGHGVQINGQNYLLATKEKYTSEYEVDDNALSVQKIMRYLTNKTNQVNVLILDACRDNPFEKNWNPQARSSDGGRGLAKIPPPTGSLIAFSTDAGNTAADGEGKNSIYCLSLAKNMQLENTSLDQVFRNVRTDVLKASNNAQRPVEASQLTGEAFYLKKGTFTDKYILIDSLIHEEQYEKGLEIAISILGEDKNNKSALLRKGRLYGFLEKNELAEADLNLANKLYPNDAEVLFYRGRFYNAIGKYDQALNDLNKAVEIDTNNADAFERRGDVFFTKEKWDLAIADYSKAITLDTVNPARYINRADLYANLKIENKAFLDYSKAIELDTENPDNWFNRGVFLTEFGHDKEALSDLEQALKINPSYVYAINVMGIIYQRQGKIELAIETYERVIALEKIDPIAAAYCYTNRAHIHQSQEKWELALADYSKAIVLDPENPDRYSNRAILYESLKKENKAFLDYSKAIELEPVNAKNWYNRGNFLDEFGHDREALSDLEQALKINPSYVDPINVMGIIYKEQGKMELAIETYERGIALEKTDPIAAAYCYNNRALIYESQEKWDLALADFSKAIALDPENPDRYTVRAFLYADLRKENKAFLDFSKAIELEPVNPDNWFKRGVFLTKFGHDKEALNDLEQALKINPSFVDAINLMGLNFEGQRKIELAIKTYERGIALEETDPIAAASCYNNRALIYESQEKWDLAIADYSKAIALDTVNPARYYSNRARLYKTMDEENKAFLDYSKAIELEPVNAKNWYNRGNFLDEFGHDKEALSDLEQALKINPSYVYAINVMGIIYQRQGKIELAIETYERGIALEETDSIAASNCYNNRAVIFQSQEKWDLALADYSKAIALDPENPDRYTNRAFLYADLKKENKALLDLSKAIELDTENTSYWYNRSTIHYESNHSREALNDLEQALNINPSYVDAINFMGVIYEEQGKIELAIKSYERGIALEETDPVASAYCYTNRARLYERQEKWDMAMNDYTKAIALDPENPERYSARGTFIENFMNKPYNALLDYTMAISLDSTETSSLWYRGKLFSEKLNNQELGIQDFNQILKIEPNDMNALNWRTICHHRNNEISKAIEGYKKIISLGDSIKNLEDKIEDYGWANINLAYIYQCEDKKEEALRLYNEGVSYSSEDPEIYYWRAWFFALYLSKYDEAISDFSSSIKLQPKNPHWLLNRSKIYYRNGDLKSAKKDMNEAVKISEESAIYFAERGNYYSITGEYDKATKDFKESLKLDSANRRTYHYITENLIRQGKIDDAVKNAKASNKLFENDTVSFEQLGRIHFAQNDFYKSLSAYSQAASIMEFNEGYRTIYPHDIQVFLSDVYLKIAEIYKNFNQSDLECEALHKAKENIILETRPDRQKMIKEIQEKLKNCQN